MPKYFNTTDGPLVVDEDGRIVGGGEWFEVKQTSKIKAAIERGDIVVVDSPKAAPKDEPKNEKEESKDDSKTAGNKGA